MEDKNISLLKAGDIEVKIKQCYENGAVALLYKTARVDMAALDSTYGAMNWTCDYKEIKGNLYCGIGVRNSSQDEFVWKWDCGIESRVDDEANQKKGEASDAFKRAGFKWGIGRELYSPPFIFLKIGMKSFIDSKGKTRYEPTDKFAKYDCTEIGYDSSGNITKVVIKCKGKTVFDNSETVKSDEKTPAAQYKLPTDTVAILKKKRGAEIRDLIAIYKVDEKTAATEIKKYGDNVSELTEEQYIVVFQKIKEIKK